MRTPPEVGGAAGPAIRGRIIRHACPDRIELDVAVAGKNVAFAIHEARLVAPLPQSAAAPVPGIEQADVPAPESLHHPTDVAGGRWRRQQVHVVVHQDIGMEAHAAGREQFAQQLQVAQPVAVIEEAGQAVVAALHDVLRDPGQRTGPGVLTSPRSASGVGDAQGGQKRSVGSLLRPWP